MTQMLVGIEITPLEASVFRVMREKGAFDVRDGTISLNFKGGEFRSIKIESYAQVDKFVELPILAE